MTLSVVSRNSGSISWIISREGFLNEVVLTQEDGCIEMSGKELPFRRIREIRISEKEKMLLHLSGVPLYHLDSVPIFREISLALQKKLNPI